MLHKKDKNADGMFDEDQLERIKSSDPKEVFKQVSTLDTENEKIHRLRADSGSPTTTKRSGKSSPPKKITDFFKKK